MHKQHLIPLITIQRQRRNTTPQLRTNPLNLNPKIRIIRKRLQRDQPIVEIIQGPEPRFWLQVVAAVAEDVYFACLGFVAFGEVGDVAVLGCW